MRLMTISDRLEAVYPDYKLISYSRMSQNVISDCPECGEDRLEKQDQYYPEPDSWIECMACGCKFDFKTEFNMWVKKREQSIS